jgi:transcriptional regulator with XRE-family HTH domain
MATRTSPTVRKRRLRAEMQRLRKESGKSAEEAAKFAGVAVATIYRIEAGTHAPKPADIMALCKLYGVDEARTEVLVTLARQSRQRGWWQRYGDTIPAWFEGYVGLEEEACVIRSYDPEGVFGPLQTKGYMRAKMLAEPETPSGGQIEQWVTVRLKRQERLDGPDAPKVWAVLGEAALHREVGGPGTMREQLNHLVDASRLRNVTLQVLPFKAGAHPAGHGAFTMLGFPEPVDPDVVYVEYRLGSLYLEQKSEVAAYATIFDHLRARALGPDESRALITQVAREMS